MACTMVTRSMARQPTSSEGEINLPSIKDINYDRYVDKDAKSIRPFIFTIDGKQYVFIGWDQNPSLKKARDYVYKEWKCMECRRRAEPLSRLISNNGEKHFLSTVTMTNTEQRNAATFIKKSDSKCVTYILKYFCIF